MEMNDYVQYGILIALLIRMFYLECTVQKMQSVIVWFCNNIFEIHEEDLEDTPAPGVKKKEEDSEGRRKE